MAEQVFKNVQVLRGIPVDEFMATMGFIAASLSLNCLDCHTEDSGRDPAKYADDTVKTVPDLKGRRVSVSTVGSLTYWLVSETSRQQGWGPDGIVITPMGATQPQIAALKRKDIEGMVTDISTALTLERNGDARILTRFGHLVKDFHIHVIFGTNNVIA